MNKFIISLALLICHLPLANALDMITTEDMVIQLLPETKSRGLVIEKRDRPSLSLTVNFEFNSSILSSDSEDILNGLGAALKDSRIANCKFEIIGHTDSVGDNQFNLNLSKRRSASVVKYLIMKYSILEKKLSIIGKGESSPLPDIDPADSKNRRVEIVNLGDCN